MADYFKSRRLQELTQQLNILREKNQGMVLCAITGIAGCGKSELAKAYAWGLPISPCTFRWRLDPDPDNTDNKATKVSYQQAYSALLYNFGIQQIKAYDTETPQQTQERLLSMLWQRINRYQEWVIIFDNVGSYMDVKNYLPKDPSIKGLVLLTSQQSSLLKSTIDANFCLNDGLNEVEAIELLKELSHRYQEDNVSGLDLIKALDYLPLGIRIAGSYIRNVGDIGFKTYTQLLGRSAHEQLVCNMGGPEFISQVTQDDKRTTTLEMAVQLSINKVKQSNSLLVKILEYSGYLANENISLDLLIKLSQTLEDEKEIEEQLKTLMIGNDNYSLLTYDKEKRTCRLHRTTQVVIRNLSFCSIEILKKLVNVILELYPFDEHSIEKFKLCQKMEPHFIALRQHIMLNTTSIIERLRLWLVLGQLAYKSSRYHLASQYFAEAWQLTQKSLDSNLHIQIDILQHLAMTQHYTKEHTAALQSINKALEIGQSIYKSTDWRLAKIYKTLGYISQWHPHSRSLGIKATDAYQYAIQICKNNHWPSRDSQLQLADSYRGIGQMKRDTSCLKEALGIYQQHLDSPSSSPHIASIYQYMGTLGLSTNDEHFIDIGFDYLTSRRYVEQSLSIMIAAYGSISYDTAVSYNWMSSLLYVSEDQKDWELALEYRNQAIDIHIRIFGDKFQRLIIFYCMKGRTLQKLNRYDDAKIAYQQCLKIAQHYPTELKNWVSLSQKRIHEIELKS